jgi:hypothetical protein
MTVAATTWVTERCYGVLDIFVRIYLKANLCKTTFMLSMQGQTEIRLLKLNVLLLGTASGFGNKRRRQRCIVLTTKVICLINLL